MSNPTLKRGSQHRVDIERVQLALNDLGFNVDLDGHFGPGLEKALCELQEAEGLTPDGVVGDKTWEILADKSPHACPIELDTSGLGGFRGDLHWLHQWEGHAGKPYWPKGKSGVTLDPGLDLGHADPMLVEKVCGPVLSEAGMTALRSVLGKKGEDAQKVLDETPDLASIRILRTTAARLLPQVAQPYWSQLCKSFEALASPSTPASVQTAMLSLGYNRGTANRDLEALKEPIGRGDWQTVADLIGNMQQDHKLEGIRKRRRAEGDLIRAALAS